MIDNIVSVITCIFAIAFLIGLAWSVLDSNEAYKRGDFEYAKIRMQDANWCAIILVVCSAAAYLNWSV